MEKAQELENLFKYYLNMYNLSINSRTIEFPRVFQYKIH